MDIIDDSVEIRVKRGVELLDYAMPDWWLSVARLDMAFSDKCVLGQLKKSYAAGLHWLGLDHGYEYGFGANPSLELGMMEQYRILTSIWRKHIRDRLLTSGTRALP